MIIKKENASQNKIKCSTIGIVREHKIFNKFTYNDYIGSL